ncbi:MAG: DUF1566 domain-containing protein [Desulfobacterales bacterium]|nr:DUF1566 domain-containing protein [Desulfobacterales bacterium]
MNSNRINRIINAFKQKYDSKVYKLACHAALPIVLSPDLLHLIRINFFMDMPDALLYTAETDLLLSPLCLEIGDDLYEIHPQVRDELLKELLKHEDKDRIRKLASLLWQYTEKFIPWRNNERLERAQQLTALNFLYPEKAREWLVIAEKCSDREWLAAMYKEINRGEIERISDKHDLEKIIYRVRSEPRRFSEDDVKVIVKKHNFFDVIRNKSGNFKNAFTDNKDGTVTDSVTDLMWEKAGSPDWMLFKDVHEYIDRLNQKKFSDWRLPTLEELASLIKNKELYDLYIDPVFDKKQRWCWSADKMESGNAWLVNFGYGYVSCYLSGLKCYVRAVRFQTI